MCQEVLPTILTKIFWYFPISLSLARDNWCLSPTTPVQVTMVSQCLSWSPAPTVCPLNRVIFLSTKEIKLLFLLETSQLLPLQHHKMPTRAYRSGLCPAPWPLFPLSSPILMYAAVTLSLSLSFEHTQLLSIPRPLLVQLPMLPPCLYWALPSLLRLRLNVTSVGADFADYHG